MKTAADVVALATAVVFAAAVLHKIQLLRRGSVAEEPLLVANSLAARAPALALTMVGALESLTVLILIVVPRYGALLAALLCCWYALELRRLPAESRCRCFGEVFGQPSVASARRRDVFLAVVAFGVCVAEWQSGPPTVDLTRVSEYGLVTVGAIAGLLVFRRLVEEEDSLDQ